KIYANDKYIAFVRSMRDLGVSLDMSAVNFTFDKDGNIVYLDDIDPDGAFSIIKFSEEKFRQAINRILDKGIKRQSLHYLERYIELSKKHP
ncbi:MAG: hypothetical protein U1A23_04805, partial [Candidatus Sungbacteria bacterium]|nr:hypothetical protein [Candidatus Sungbacteria bacterium]